MHRLAVLVLALVLVVPAAALAHRAPPRLGEATSAGGAAGPAADAIAPGGGGVGAGAARRRIMADPPLDAPTLHAALAGTSGELEQCMAASGVSGTIHVTASISLAHALGLDIGAPRHDVAVTQCAELVLRRALTALAARPLDRPLRSTLAVRHRVPRAPRVPPPAPPATGDLSAFEGPVRAAIENDRSAMISCLSSAAPGTTGDASLRMTLRPDGTLSLASASLPSGVPAGPALPCLSSRIANLHFAPAPPRAITITHTLPLGL